MTPEEERAKTGRLVQMLHDRGNGDDSKKRALAIELLVGDADGDQTIRLAQFAVSFVNLRRMVRAT
jgi:hypothetical protein